MGDFVLFQKTKLKKEARQPILEGLKMSGSAFLIKKKNAEWKSKGERAACSLHRHAWVCLW